MFIYWVVQQHQTMTVVNRTVIYVPDSLVSEAREKGLANLSKFVRERLIEFNAGVPTARSSTPATATNGGE